MKESPVLRNRGFCCIEVMIQIAEKAQKNRGIRPRNCENYSLTKNTQYDTMIIHTVILCLFLDFISNMVILSQEWATVK